FFFSSRRRHTRSDRDWSSDVCSSDLVVKAVSPYTKELTLTHLADETHEFKLESATGQILGYGIGVIYTPLYESTWTAAAAPDGKIGRASCRERVQISVRRGSVKKQRC